MDLMKNISLSSASLALLGTLLSCAPARNQSARKTFVPPAESASRLLPPPPPVIQGRVEVESIPRFLTPGQGQASNTRVEALLSEADFHFLEGRRLYRQGDENGARREFDHAVDVLLDAPESATVRGPIDRKIEELVDAIHRLDLADLGAADSASEPPFERPPLEDIPQLTFPVDPKLKNKVAEELRATASQLPLELNETVLSYVNYFSSERGRRLLISGLRRSGRYRPLIQRIFDEEGVPQELIFLAQAESGFLPRAVSRARAVGMWQFMLASGHAYGLMQTRYRDDRMDPDLSTRAAARNLRSLYQRYGDWYLAMAAYNCGPGVVDKAVERTGYADFWELRRRNTMPRESTNYVPAILAMTIMVKNGREYGLENLELDPPLEYDVVEIAAPTHLALIADLTETPVPQLRDLNPALLTNVAPRGSPLKVPKDMGNALVSAIDAVPAGMRIHWRAHRVTGGETMASVALRYGLREEALASANPRGALSPGDVLAIPVAGERARIRTRAATGKYVAARSSGAQRSSKKAAPQRSAKPGAYAQASIAPNRTKHITVKQ